LECQTSIHVAANTVFILPEFRTLSDSIAVDRACTVDGFVAALGVNKIAIEPAIEGNS
jgi:hypothetical protein